MDQHWQRLCEIEEVTPGSVRSCDEFDVVVWADSAGTPHVVDSRCPHQWSHFGAVGFVDGEELVCGEHFWRFDEDGHGSKQAMNGRRDPKSDVATFVHRVDHGELWAMLPGAVTREEMQ